MATYHLYYKLFQFTHPGRGATYVSAKVEAICNVSIHAPREGCDLHVLLTLVLCSQFQFTHPGRGATRLWYGSAFETISFNSRTPGGVRRAAPMA